MNAREYLQQIRRLDVLIENYRNELEECSFLQSEFSRYGGNPSSWTGTGNISGPV